jgi:hypothetical protein
MYELMKSGDLIVFSGTDPIGAAITKVTRSQYTHVGLVLIVKGTPCILESTIGPVGVDVLALQEVQGVGITDLRHRVQAIHDAATGERVWHAARTTALTYEQECKLMQYALGIHGIEYDMVQALLSAMDSLDAVIGKGKSDLTKLFCSELVVACELACTGTVYHDKHDPPINASRVVPYEVLELHVSGTPIWGPLVEL